MTNLNSNENIVQSMRATTELSRLKAERNRLDKIYVQLGGDYIAAKKSDKKRKTKELKLEWELRMAEKNYAALKEKLGYERIAIDVSYYIFGLNHHPFPNTY
jgi:hypothetical protein